MTGVSAQAGSGKGAGGGAGVSRYDPGTTPVRTTPLYSRGGLAATLLAVDAIDVSGWASPQIEITIGAGGTAPAATLLLAKVDQAHLGRLFIPIRQA